MAQKKSGGRKAAKKTAPKVTKTKKKAPRTRANTNAAIEAQGAAIMHLLKQKATPSVNVVGMMVGIRNISSSTIGIAGSPTPNEGEVQLAAAFGGMPGGFAVISYPWYRQLRKGRFFLQGLLVRDDSVLGPVDVPAPADEPSDIPPEHAINRIDDPTSWIESRNEAALRKSIKAITSEQSLRRIMAAVDAKVEENRKALGCDGSMTDENQAKEEEAAMMLPSQYSLTEKLVEQRLNELAPGLVK